MWFRKNKTDATLVAGVKRYVELLGKTSDLDHEDLMPSMSSSGVTPAQAWQILGLVPTVVARTIMSDLGISFSHQYTVLNSRGQTASAGLFDKHPVVVATQSVLPEVMASPAAQSIALRSAELAAVNELLNSGSDPKDLMTAPVTLTAYETEQELGQVSPEAAPCAAPDGLI